MEGGSTGGPAAAGVPSRLAGAWAIPVSPPGRQDYHDIVRELIIRTHDDSLASRVSRTAAWRRSEQHERNWGEPGYRGRRRIPALHRGAQPPGPGRGGTVRERRALPR